MLSDIITRNDSRLIGWFLENGADPNLGPHQGPEIGIEAGIPAPNSGASLDTAAAFSATNVVDLLITYGAKLENSIALHRAVGSPNRSSQGNIVMMEHLVRLGSDINQLGYPEGVTGGGTPLHCACSLGRVLEAKWLLDHGADPQKKNFYGYYPDAFASINKHSEVLDLFRERFGRLFSELP